MSDESNKKYVSVNLLTDEALNKKLAVVLDGCSAIGKDKPEGLTATLLSLMLEVIEHRKIRGVLGCDHLTAPLPEDEDEASLRVFDRLIDSLYGDKMTKGELATMVRAVRDEDNPQGDEALREMVESSFEILELMCRLLPEETLKGLEAEGDDPLWKVK